MTKNTNFKETRTKKRFFLIQRILYIVLYIMWYFDRFSNKCTYLILWHALFSNDKRQISIWENILKYLRFFCIFWYLIHLIKMKSICEGCIVWTSFHLFQFALFWDIVRQCRDFLIFLKFRNNEVQKLWKQILANWKVCQIRSSYETSILLLSTFTLWQSTLKAIILRSIWILPKINILPRVLLILLHVMNC